MDLGHYLPKCVYLFTHLIHGFEDDSVRGAGNAGMTVRVKQWGRRDQQRCAVGTSLLQGHTDGSSPLILGVGELGPGIRKVPSGCECWMDKGSQGAAVGGKGSAIPSGNSKPCHGTCCERLDKSLLWACFRNAKWVQWSLLPAKVAVGIQWAGLCKVPAGHLGPRRPCVSPEDATVPGVQVSGTMVRDGPEGAEGECKGTLGKLRRTSYHGVQSSFGGCVESGGFYRRGDGLVCTLRGWAWL